MFRIDLFRTAPFRLTLGLVAVIILGMVLQLGLLYGQMDAYEQLRSSEFLRHSAEMLVREPPRELEVKLRDRSTNELRVFLNGAALFDNQHRFIAGDIKIWPSGLTESGDIQPSTCKLSDGTITPTRFLVVRVKGPDGAPDRLLVLERSRHVAAELRYIARRAAMWSVAPLVLLALIAGMFLSQRALSRIKKMRHAIERIMKGDLHERLPVGRGNDDLERLVGSVNRMLERLEQLVGEIRDVGNDIAHDLRTPLARVQARLERATSMLPRVSDAVAACSPNGVPEEMGCFEEVLAQSQRDLEQCFAVITALLRIGEIETGQRRAGFVMMTLVPLIEDIVDLYEPIAEAGGLRLYTDIAPQDRESGLVLFGDRDLLNEVLANLLDNALKFTERGGEIVVRAGLCGQDTGRQGIIWFEVRDTGIGIIPEEREAVLGRFYRTDKSRHVPGSGLGLSLVAAIIALHDARLEIEDNMPHNQESGRVEAGNRSVGTVFRVIFQPSKEGPEQGIMAEQAELLADL